MTTVLLSLSRPLFRLLSRSPVASDTMAGHRSATGPADVAHRIAHSGIDTLTDEELSALTRAGEVAGAHPTLLGVLSDRAEPRPARERAFGMISVQIEQSRGVGYHLVA